MTAPTGPSEGLQRIMLQDQVARLRAEVGSVMNLCESGWRYDNFGQKVLLVDDILAALQ